MLVVFLSFGCCFRDTEKISVIFHSARVWLCSSPCPSVACFAEIFSLAFSLSPFHIARPPTSSLIFLQMTEPCNQEPDSSAQILVRKGDFSVPPLSACYGSEWTAPHSWPLVRPRPSHSTGSHVRRKEGWEGRLAAWCGACSVVTHTASAKRLALYLELRNKTITSDLKVLREHLSCPK